MAMVQSSVGSLHETDSPAARLRRPRLAFTIVELLVVISLMSILVALTMPAFSAARESARMIACKSNLTRISIGLSAYADSKGAWRRGAFDWKRDGALTFSASTLEIAANPSALTRDLQFSHFQNSSNMRRTSKLSNSYVNS
jgi:prepilin-type N-terminal cleavage/methylation domain-containing protein